MFHWTGKKDFCKNENGFRAIFRKNYQKYEWWVLTKRQQRILPISSPTIYQYPIFSLSFNLYHKMSTWAVNQIFHRPEKKNTCHPLNTPDSLVLRAVIKTFCLYRRPCQPVRPGGFVLLVHFSFFMFFCFGVKSLT